jgi:cytochrome c oxidase subunit 1
MAHLMMGIVGISVVAASLGGLLYILITVGSILFGKPVIGTFKAAPAAAVRDSGHAGLGVWGFSAPGTFVFAIIFLVAFVLYYFVNWKYLSAVWGLS